MVRAIKPVEDEFVLDAAIVDSVAVDKVFVPQPRPPVPTHSPVHEADPAPGRWVHEVEYGTIRGVTACFTGCIGISIRLEVPGVKIPFGLSEPIHQILFTLFYLLCIAARAVVLLE